MNKCKVFFAALLILPLLAFGAEVNTSTGVAAAGMPQMTSPNQYECCWVYWMGRWTCFPCG